MRTLIENYRGWDISFDTDTEEFYCISNEYDNDKTKKTYSLAKKYVDDYIKENAEFRPFEVCTFTNQFGNKSTIKIIGIRKDERFIYEDSNGKKQQISDYDEKSWFLVNSENDPIELEINSIYEQIQKLRLQIKELENNLIKVSLKDIKSKYLNK